MLCRAAPASAQVQEVLWLYGRTQAGLSLKRAQHGTGVLWMWDLAGPLGSFVIWLARLAAFERREILSDI